MKLAGVMLGNRMCRGLKQQMWLRSVCRCLLLLVLLSIWAARVSEVRPVLLRWLGLSKCAGWKSRVKLKASLLALNMGRVDRLWKGVCRQQRCGLSARWSVCLN